MVRSPGMYENDSTLTLIIVHTYLHSQNDQPIPRTIQHIHGEIISFILPTALFIALNITAGTDPNGFFKIFLA